MTRVGGEDVGGVAAAPLAGFRVVDVSQSIAGGFCTKLLADYGAEVIKVEPPGGEPTRALGPLRGTDGGVAEAGSVFSHLHTNKLGIVVDTAHAGGPAVVRDLVMTADVLVESGCPGELAAIGLAPGELLAARPSLVITSVTPFGQTGPYASYRMTEIVAYAMGGPMSSSGSAAREPVKLAGNVVQMQSGATATTATLGALYGASTTGRGQHVDVATFETQNGSADRRRYYLLSYAYSGHAIRRVTAAGAALVAAGGRFEAADGAVVTTGRIWPNHLPRMIAVLADDTLSRLFAAKGEAILAEDIDTVNGALAAWAASRPARDAMREAQAAGWPVIVVNDPWTLLRDEHLVARGFWVTAPGDTRQLPLCGPPWRIDGGGWALRRGAPRLGEHTDDVLERVTGYSPHRVRGLRDAQVVA